jgi:CRP-like cAMP-binding protein
MRRSGGESDVAILNELAAEAIDEAYAGNRLLMTFPADLRSRIGDIADLVQFDEGAIVLDRGDNVSRSIFPLAQTTISLSAEVEANKTIEVTSIGREGAVGGIVSCGHAPAFCQARVVVPGPALTLPMEIVEDAKAHSGHLRNLFCRYSDYLLAQIMQSVACSNFHPIGARAARWLLTAQDRAGPRLELTQEALARLLGVQRTTLNAVAQDLQERGLINIRRGAIEIVDRAGLLGATCGCYAAVEQFFGDMIGDSGTGGNPDCG